MHSHSQRNRLGVIWKVGATFCRWSEVERVYSEGESLRVTPGAGEMAQRLGALAALAKDPGSVPSTHV